MIVLLFILASYCTENPVLDMLVEIKTILANHIKKEYPEVKLDDNENSETLT